MLLNLEPKGFAIDISDSSLKIVQLKKKKGSLRLASFGSNKIPFGIVKNGEIKDPLRLADIIKNTLANNIKGETIKTSYVFASLPEEKSFLDILQVPLVEAEELERVVRYEVENHIPLGLNKVYFDFRKIGDNTLNSNKKYQEVLIVASPKTVVDSYLATFEKAGLLPVHLEIESLSLARSLLKKPGPKRPVLIIDFGKNKTGLIIFSRGSVRFTSSIPVSSKQLTSNLRKVLGVTGREAEKIKKREGLEGDEKIFEALIPAIVDLAEQIKRYIKYYYSHSKKLESGFPSKSPEKIILSGQGSNLPGLIGFLASSLNLKVEIGNPWVNILDKEIKEVPDLSFKKSLGFSTALGLSLKEYYD
jgi:type IV pilus assembly protein PilM